MIVPVKFQIFAQTVILTNKDEARLNAHLSSWGRLNEMFLIQAFNEPDLRRLVVIELMDKKRWKIVNRLLMRLTRLERKQLADKARKLCSR